MTLMLHRGGTEVEYEQLRALVTPEATHSHVPLPHHQLTDMVKYALGYYGHEIVEEHHALDKDGARYFGLLTLKSSYGDYTDTLGLRNSHDKSMPIGLAFGSRVFVCDNMAFHAEHVVRRKHTAGSRRELPALIAEIVEPLKAKRLAQHETIDRYKTTEIGNELADHLVIEAYRRGIIGLQKIPDVCEQWHRPQYDWGPNSLWRLFNGFTYTLAGKIAEAPQLTRNLHTLLDEHVA